MRMLSKTSQQWRRSFQLSLRLLSSSGTHGPSDPVICRLIRTPYIISYEDYETKTQKAVNFLWLISLVFSIFSAINSQIAYHWRSARYISPSSRLPWWVSLGLTRAPLMFLAAAVTTFLAGLVCFTFAIYGRLQFISIAVASVTSLCSFALLAVTLWLVREDQTVSQTSGMTVSWPQI